jgi:hypothetical protein
MKTSNFNLRIGCGATAVWKNLKGKKWLNYLEVSVGRLTVTRLLPKICNYLCEVRGRKEKYALKGNGIKRAEVNIMVCSIE